MGKYSILFPSVDCKQAITLTKKHILAVETIINYDSNDDTDICKLGAVMYSSNICAGSLDTIRKTFRIPSNFMMVETLVDGMAHLPQEGASQSTGSS